MIRQSGANIGIGTTTPAAKLDIVGGNVNLENSTATSGNILKGGTPFLHNYGNSNTFLGLNAGNFTMMGAQDTAIGLGALYNNTTGFGNTASGYQALYSNTTASGNTAIGLGALYNNTTGQYNTAIGYLADACEGCGNLSNATAIGAGAIVDASNKIRLDNTGVTVVEGPPYSAVSDKNAKENFKPVDAEDVLQKIRAMNVTSWNYIGQDPKQFRHYGPVAQDFFASFGDDGVGTIGSATTITSTDMNGVLMLAVQALGRENAELKARIEALERLVEKSRK